jgi:hypothetical protein
MTKASHLTVTLAALFLGLCLATASQRSAAGDKDKERPTVPPEMKVLEKRVGDWTTTTRIKPAEWTPEAVESKGVEKIELVMHGRFIQGKVRTQPADVEAIWLGTYDPAQKAYRLWYFSSQGDIVETSGKWDAKTNTMTWTNNPQPGITAIARWRFPTADTFEWDLVAKDRSGKVYLDMEGKLRRRK